MVKFGGRAQIVSSFILEINLAYHIFKNCSTNYKIIESFLSTLLAQECFFQLINLSDSSIGAPDPTFG